MSILNRLAGSTLCLLIALLLAPPGLVLADETDEPIIAARINLVEGEVNYQRAKDTDKDWYEATLNLPLHESDQIYSGPGGRAELQLSGRNLVRINHETNLRFTQFKLGYFQLALPVGTATFRLDSLDRSQFQAIDAQDKTDPVYFEVDSPTVAVTLLKEGNYRVNVSADGTTEVIVRRGQAEVFNQEIGTISVKEGRRFVIEGADRADKDDFQVTKLKDQDDWDRWNEARDEELSRQIERNTSQLPEAVPGVYDLDNYGEWIDSSDYGSVWSPSGVGADWAPYRDGCWNWYSSYGWRWVSYERWGWVPYHYGRWVYWRSRWCWIPRPVYGAGPGYGWRWAPHLTVFVGSHGGRNWMGWFPLGPGEPYHRGFHPHPIESLRNYRSPGGLSVLDRRRFDHGRVIVKRDQLIAPARFDKPGEQAPVAMKADEIKTPKKAPTRTALVERGRIARRLEAPVIARGSLDGRGSNRQFHPSVPSPAGPDRLRRLPDYRPAERISPPVWRSKKEESGRSESNPAAGDQTRPGRNLDRPSRDASPAPATPERDRREPPRNQRNSTAPEDSHRREHATGREAAPPRNADRIARPDSPARERAPSGNPGRPSAPQTPRESAPPRPSERPSSPSSSRPSSSSPSSRPSSPPPSSSSSSSRPSSPSPPSSSSSRPSSPSPPSSSGRKP